MLKTFTVFPLMRKQAGVVAPIAPDVNVAGTGLTNSAPIKDAGNSSPVRAISNQRVLRNVKNSDRLVLVHATPAIPIVRGGVSAAGQNDKKRPITHSALKLTLNFPKG